MTKGQSQFFRFVFFLLGAGIIILAFYLTKGENELTGNDKFMWISISLMYLFAFLPFFFSVINISNFSAKIPSLAMVWAGIFLYIPASAAVILALKNSIILFNTALIIQAVLVFLFFLDIYFAYFANSHIQAVAVEESGKLQYVTEMKNKALLLVVKAGSLTEAYEQIQGRIKKTAEDIRYFSPLDRGKSMEADLKIINSIENLSRLCDVVSEGGHPDSFDAEINKLQLLIKERKLLRN
ncbi:MAG: hypothetical protein LBP76_07450 [Treponema sp.]|jgi:hypothetical protein|nr:hypothetical protein [Treponema sp.]